MLTTSRMVLTALVLIGLLQAGCSVFKGGTQSSLRKALTFHASFDHGTDAEYAQGDPWIYQAPSMDKKREARPGLPSGDAVALQPTAGKYGGALRFLKRSGSVVFYRGKDNVVWNGDNWSGTISFWLRADLKELAEGFCDPLQLTPRMWNDAAFFVEFEKRPTGTPFRLGAYADYPVWNPKDRKFEDIPPGQRPVVAVPGPPFSGDRWTHVAFTWERFNTGKTNGMASLYLDGALMGSIAGRNQKFTWKPAEVRLMLGLGFIGSVDDVAVFNRALDADEIQQVRRLPRGVASLLRP